MSFPSQIALFAGGFVLCFAIMFPFMMKWNNPVKPSIPTNSDHSYLKSASREPLVKAARDNSKNVKSQKSWILFFAPIYVFGVCVYVLFKTYRVFIKQRQETKPNSLKSTARKTEKKLLNRNQLHDLEYQLKASERSVDEILRKACRVMKDAYQQEERQLDSISMDSSGMSESSDDELQNLRETEIATTSSANNESHQDSTSSSEAGKPLHHRRVRHRTKKHFVDALCDLSTSDEEEKDFAPHATTSSFMTGSSDSETELSRENISDVALESSSNESSEDCLIDSKPCLTSVPALTLKVRTTHPVSDKLDDCSREISLENDNTTPRVEDKSSKRGEEDLRGVEKRSEEIVSQQKEERPPDQVDHVSSGESPHSILAINKSTCACLINTGEKPTNKDDCPGDVGNPPCFVEQVRDRSLTESAEKTKTVVAAADGESIKNDTDKKKLLNEKVKFMQTTKEVINAMGELKDFIKEQKDCH